MVPELKGIQYGQEETNVLKLGKILTEESDFLGKSKVRPPPQEGHEESLDSRESSTASPTPTWGRSKEENHEQRLQKWIDTPIRPPTNTTWLPHQFESTKTRSETGDNKAYKINPDKVNREARDDEIEFTRIPIAGEDSEDYDADYEMEEEEDEVTATLPIVFPIPCSTPPPNLPINDSSIDLNAYIADEIAFRVGPRKDGIIEEIRFFPVSLTPNSFQSLAESSECDPHTQNMQSFPKYEHQRKLTKAERTQKREYQQWREKLEDAPATTREPKRKQRRLTRPSLTVQRTPDNDLQNDQNVSPYPTTHTAIQLINNHH